MRTIKVYDKEYHLQFRHINLQRDTDGVDALEAIGYTFRDAVKAGQVKLHAHEIRDLEDLGKDLEDVIDPALAGASFSGATVCYIENADREVVATGYAFCSLSDQFSKKQGRTLAFGRAVGDFKREHLSATGHQHTEFTIVS